MNIIGAKSFKVVDAGKIYSIYIYKSLHTYHYIICCQIKTFEGTIQKQKREGLRSFDTYT